MFADINIEKFIDYILFASCIFLLVGSIFISIRLRFIQLRFIPHLTQMISKLAAKKQTGNKPYTISPAKALFTAMSTTLGIGTMVGPVIAIHFGGPGALIGFLLTSFFGSATTFTEVNLAVKFRKKLANGQILGGPMQYLKVILSSGVAKWYAISCGILMMAWSAAQANQLAAILDSPLLGSYRCPVYISGILISTMVVLTLLGGIKRISDLSAKLIPLMFVLYIGSSLWILLSDIDKLWIALGQIVESAFTPYAMISGTLVGGIVSAMRWGIFKGTQITESGIGTQSIPHSMAETSDSYAQGSLAMLSTYTAGLIAFISGCVVLTTGTWQNPELPVGISMVAASFHMYFSSFGIVIIGISAILFAFGTILGNCYNGSQCYSYITKNNKFLPYYFLSALIIFLGTISEVKTVWSLIDLVLVFIAFPHMTALILYVHQNAAQLRNAKKDDAKEVVDKLATEIK